MFTPEVIEVFKKQRIELLSRIDQLELELEECKTSTAALETLLRNEGHSILEDHFEVPNRYPYDENLTNKLLYVLSELEEATAKRIAEEIISYHDIIDNHYDSDEEKDKLFRTITLYASRLFNEGRIEAKKVGNTNVYSLPRKRGQALLKAMNAG